MELLALRLRTRILTELNQPPTDTADTDSTTTDSEPTTVEGTDVS
jgi:hypothetical protein